jgi:hypothetical protein
VARFETGLDLYDFIKTRMPWQAPGSRNDEEYWQLTAYLLRANSIQPPDPLNAQNATSVKVRASLIPEQTPTEIDLQKQVTQETIYKEKIASWQRALLAMTNNKLWLVGLTILVLVPVAFLIKRIL